MVDAEQGPDVGMMVEREDVTDLLKQYEMFGPDAWPRPGMPHRGGSRGHDRQGGEDKPARPTG